MTTRRLLYSAITHTPDGIHARARGVRTCVAIARVRARERERERYVWYVSYVCVCAHAAESAPRVCIYISCACVWSEGVRGAACEHTTRGTGTRKRPLTSSANNESHESRCESRRNIRRAFYRAAPLSAACTREYIIK